MRYEIMQLADGWAGTAQTVEKIYELVNQALLDPVVVAAAHHIVRHLPERDKDAEIEAISAFVRSRVRYTHESVETVKTPRVMIDEIRKYGKAVGDCDDSVLLWLALHRIVGSRINAEVVSQRADKQASHIFGEVYSPTRGWVTDDTIVKRKPLGWKIPARNVTERRTWGMNGLGRSTMKHKNPGLHLGQRAHGLVMANPGLTIARTNLVAPHPGRHLAVGRTKLRTASTLAPRRRGWIRKHLRPSEYRMKPPGMLFVDPATGRLSGVGFFESIVSFAQSVAPVAKTAYETYKTSKISLPKPPPPPTAPTQTTQTRTSSGGGMGGTGILLLAVAAALALGRRR